MNTLLLGRALGGAFRVVRYATKSFRTAVISLGLVTICLFQAQAQEGPEYIQGWAPLEEAEFHFDVMFAVVKCSPGAEPVILLNAFNEGGNVQSIGFTLALEDASGNKATIEVPKFEIGNADMQIATCEGDAPHLKLAMPDGINPANFSIEITYNK